MLNNTILTGTGFGAGNGFHETKSDKFHRLANRRFRAFKAQLDQIAVLGTSSAYEASPEDLETLIVAMTKEFNFLVERLRRRNAFEDSLF